MAFVVMIFARVVKNIFVGCVVGCIATLVMLQQDPWVKHFVNQYIQDEFGKAGACTMRGTLNSLNFFSPGFEMSDVVVEPLDGKEWSWKAKKLRVRCHWLYILFHHALDVHIELDDFQARSTMRSHVCPIVEQHFNKLLFGPPLAFPLIPTLIICKNASVIVDDEYGNTAAVTCNSSSKKQNKNIKTAVDLIDGSFRMHDVSCAEQLNGSLTVTIGPDSLDKSFSVSGKCQASISQLPRQMQRCTIDGSWDGGKGSIHIHNEKAALALTGDMFLKEDGFHVYSRGIFPLVPILKTVKPTGVEIIKDGTSVVESHIQVVDNKMQIEGKGTIEGLKTFYDYDVGACAFTFNKKDADWSGATTLTVPLWGILAGKWRWNSDTHNGDVAIRAQESIQLPFKKSLRVNSDGTFFTLTYRDKAISGSYGLRINSDDADMHVLLKGNYKGDTKEINSVGTLNGKGFSFALALQPHVRLLHLKNTDKKEEFVLRGNQDSSLSGTLGMPFVQEVCSQLYGLQLSPEGIIDVHIDVQNPMNITFSFQNGAVRIPHTYNVLHAVSGTLAFDFSKKELIIKNLIGSLYKGDIKINYACVKFDAEFKPAFVYAPIIIESCLLNLNKDLFAMVSGNVIARYEQSKQPELKGHCIIEHAQMKENIFSDSFQRRIFKQAGTIMSFYNPDKIPDIACDISLTTMNPINIKTGFLEAAAKVNLRVTNSFKTPEVSGTVSLVSGNLLFPYKPLAITQGTLYFAPHTLYDPHIELVAKNTIKKHTIGMHITGTITHPHVMLESSPPLTEEQIIALMLVGSPQQSLNLVMPALLMNNLTMLIFGDNQSPRSIDHYFKNLLKPFKNIHFVPSFTDQSGRGGLRGAVEIEVNDRLHALIQKNFSLTEDTRFELEYLLSDDISLKAFRDERRDVGGEVEMKWKF